MLFFEELGLTHKRVAEIAIDVYSILSKGNDIAQGLKEIKRKYRDSEHAIKMLEIALKELGDLLPTLTQGGWAFTQSFTL